MPLPRESVYPTAAPDLIAHLADCIYFTHASAESLGTTLARLQPGVQDLPRLTRVLGNQHVSGARGVVGVWVCGPCSGGSVGIWRNISRGVNSVTRIWSAWAPRGMCGSWVMHHLEWVVRSQACLRRHASRALWPFTYLPHPPCLAR